MAIQQFQGVDKNGNAVTIYVTDDPAEGGGATLNDIATALGGTLTVTDDGGLTISSLPDDVVTNDPAEGGGSTLNDIVTALGGTLTVADDGGLAISSFPNNIITNNDELRTTASVSVSEVRIEAPDAAGNGDAVIEREDGEAVLKVSNKNKTRQVASTPWTDVVSDALVEVAATDVEVLSIMASVNTQSDPVYLKIFEGTGNALGTDAASFDQGIPAGSGFQWQPEAAAFAGGLEVAVTGGPGATDSTATAASISVNIAYREA